VIRLPGVSDSHRASAADRGQDAGPPQVAARYVVMGMRLAAVALNFVVQVAMAHLMDLDSFGTANTALALLSIFVIPAGLNHEMTAIRYVALTRDDLPLMRSLTILFVKRIAVASAVSCSLIAGLAGVQLVLGNTKSATAIGMLLLILPPMALLLFGEGWLRGFGSLVRALINSGVIVPLITVALLVCDRIFLQDGATIGVVGALGARALATVAALLSVTLFMRTKLGGSFTPRTGVGPELRAETRTTAYALTGIALLGVTTTQAGIVAVSLFEGPAEAGIFSAAVRITQATGIALVAVNFVLAPRIARLYEKGKGDQLQREISSAAGWSTSLMFLACLVLVPGASVVLGLFGSGFGGAAGALRILMVGQVVNALTGPVAVVLQMTGRESLAIRALAYSFVLEFVLFAVLIPLLGLTGAAIATAVCNAGQYLVMIIYVRRDMGIWSLPNVVTARLPKARI
jgi:O-antigen/teichoic acid export membrane protein